MCILLVYAVKLYYNARCKNMKNINFGEIVSEGTRACSGSFCTNRYDLCVQRVGVNTTVRANASVQRKAALHCHLKQSSSRTERVWRLYARRIFAWKVPDISWIFSNVKMDILPSVIHQGSCPINASPRIQEVCWILTSLLVLHLMPLYR